MYPSQKQHCLRSPWHEGELNGGEKCKYRGGTEEVVREGGVGLLVVLQLRLEGLKGEAQS